MFISVDGVAEENLMIEPMIIEVIHYLKNVTQGVALFLTFIELKIKKKSKNMCVETCFLLFLAINGLTVKVDALSDAVGDQSLMLGDFENNTYRQFRSQNTKYKYPGN